MRISQQIADGSEPNVEATDSNDISRLEPGAASSALDRLTDSRTRDIAPEASKLDYGVRSWATPSNHGIRRIICLVN